MKPRQTDPGGTATKPVELVTKEEFVTRRLREQVISGELAPGTRLRQEQLASEFGISPTPVREALRRLVSEGYLSSEPHVGVAVAHPVAEWTLEVFEIRQTLEGKLAAGASQNMTTQRIALLRELNRDFRRATAKRDFVAARLLNYRFHHLIWEDAKLPVTLEIVNSLWAKFPLYNLGNVEGRGERSTDEHEHLIECMERRNARDAEHAAFVHIGGGRQDFLRMMQSRAKRGDIATPAKRARLSRPPSRARADRAG